MTIRKVMDYTEVEIFGYEEIKKMIKKGWQPWGSPYVWDRTRPYQAMVKYKDEKLDFSKFDSEETKNELIWKLKEDYCKQKIKKGDHVLIKKEVVDAGEDEKGNRIISVDCGCPCGAYYGYLESEVKKAE